ncbi:PKD domain-containing protein [Marinigracilibium pacificum]|uniref:PKD domain-containing protein n=1 Tax=Marinigracilibium pacificum TaxID=2729599 RepID=A0A848IWN1_9BACT|nr:PKD domain-containing protein [Marinigracilibium pacificum]NMM48933.1 PKD domain-containing protein [Marinigracilibium pacificum]
MKAIKLLILSFSVLVFIAGCKEEDPLIPPFTIVKADFSYQLDNGLFAPATATFNSDVVFTDGDNIEYFWSFGDGASSTEANPSHLYTSPGFYEVTLTVVGSGDTDSHTSTLEVRDPGRSYYPVIIASGSGKRIYDAQTGVIDVSLDVSPFDIAIDSVREKIYFTASDAGAVYSLGFSDDTPAMVVDGLSNPHGIAIDESTGMAYVADRGDNAIYAVDVEAGTKSVLFSDADEATFSLPEGLDYHNGFVYVTAVDFDAEAVWKVNVSDGAFDRIIGYSAGGYGYSIVVNSQSDRIYFHNDEGPEFLNASLSGTDISTLVSSAGSNNGVDGRSFGVTISYAEGKVYWTEAGNGLLKRANLDGTEVQTIASGLTDPLGVELVGIQ